jgi:RNA polymerase sigma factor for flagellar operon FliA
MESMKTDTGGVRDRLICDHADDVKKVVMRMARRCPTWVPREDLVSAGMVGLIEAADRYDPSRDEVFWAFAEHRIRGAVLDELRRGDILPRRVRQLARRIAAVLRKLEHASGRAPTDGEVASELGMSIESYREDTWAVRNHHVGPLDDAARTLVDHAASAPDDAADHNHTLARVRDALATLDARDVRILGMHFLEELSFSQIAADLGVTPSRVCQLLWRAIDRLRGTLGVQILEAA